MKPTINLTTFPVVFAFLIMLTLSHFTLSQGNSNGNANSNNNANGNALKWETQGNNADTSDFIGTTNPTALKMRTNNVERIRITKDGKIGVGINNPTFDFEVNKPASFNDEIYLKSVDTVSDLSTRGILVIDNNGKIEKIDEIILDQYSSANQGLSNFCDLNTGYMQSPTWLNEPNTIYTPCPEIKVGIGTNNPQSALDVIGRTKTNVLQVGRAYSQFSLVSGFQTSPNNRVLLTYGQYNPQTQEEKVALQLMSSGELVLNYTSNYGNTNTADVFRVNSYDDDRNLLLLENNGLLRARRIKIDQQPWSDHVFDVDYELMPLDELQYFIQTNGHLPEVPTTEEVQEEGVDLAETNALLLKKIEELTLYLLEQKEETEELRKELEELKALVNQ